ncbi:sulfite exporter TauE/SafE family protein [Carnobacteriaceae bacterium zg-C25]|nr:sulfite exporter TauE/SafE family protein [Carnobacteriaceae bacterium zg-ZUI240]QTU82497.1 sulfite exporter TauE/SafE family protein [Carnobacteriaceae bacterium zg-C25]
MVQSIVYSVVVLCATIVGAATGVGGGAIIKPVFDLLGMDNAVIIGVYATVAVFSMCLTSVYRQMKKGVKFNKRVAISLSIGSVIGGYVGEFVFKTLTNKLPDNTIKFYQSFLLGIILVLVMIYTLNSARIRQHHLQNKLVIMLLSFFVGVISTFLGIGGGQLNLALLMFCFGLSTKHAAIYSLTMIFFSQLSKVILLLTDIHDYNIDWVICGAIIVFSFLGGVIGTKINHQFKPKTIEKIYLGLMVVLLCVCVMNMMSNIG